MPYWFQKRSYFLFQRFQFCHNSFIIFS